MSKPDQPDDGNEHVDNELFAELTRAVEPVEPSPALRTSIMDSLVAGARFMRFSERVAGLIDRSVEHAEDLLAAIDYAPNWEPSPLGHIDLLHIDGGPATDGAIVGFIRLQPGTEFPDHEHLGEEKVLVLQGSFTDDDGHTYEPGDLVVEQGGSEHGFRAGDGPPLIYLVVADEGIKVLGMTVGPDDPRM